MLRRAALALLLLTPVSAALDAPTYRTLDPGLLPGGLHAILSGFGVRRSMLGSCHANGGSIALAVRWNLAADAPVVSIDNFSGLDEYDSSMAPTAARTSTRST